ncbi:MAG: YidB family protein [Candidatus Kapaibacteriota bacterium]
MGLMDLVGQVAGAALGGGAEGGGQSALINAVGSMISQQGGIEGLMQAFQQGGAGEMMQSWVGTGQNLPISPEMLTSVLGSEQVAALAQQVGIPPEMATTALTQVLPMVIDQLTPNGAAPQGDALQAGLGALLGGLFK